MTTTDDTPHTSADELRAIARSAAAVLRSIESPTERYHAARDVEPLLKGELAAVARTAVDELYDQGMKPAEIGATLGISRQRAEQLVDPVKLAAARSAALERRQATLQDQMKRVRSAKRKVGRVTGATAADQAEQAETA